MLKVQHPSVIGENEETPSNSSSGSPIIDCLIEESYRNPVSPQNALRWIPFENFRGIECFAQGEFAEIALAFHQRSKWQPITSYEKEIPDNVALRFIKNSREIDERLVNEIRTHHKCMIHSQNVIPIYGLTQDSQTLDYALVLKHARHGDLRKFLRKGLAWPEKFRMLIKIARTLKEIHELDLVHRDFHCKNILVDDDNGHPGDGYELFVSDFGLCMDVSSSKTDLNVIEGVLPYIAPEILLGSKYSPKTDIYSFGMIMWELVSGQSPYHEYQVHDIRLALDIIRGVRPIIPEGTSDEFQNLINACWNSDPANRPDSGQLLMIFEGMLRMCDGDDGENKNFGFEGVEVSREVGVLEEEDNYDAEQVDLTPDYDALENEDATVHSAGITLSDSQQPIHENKICIVNRLHKQAADDTRDHATEGNIFMLRSIANPKDDSINSVDNELVQHHIGATPSDEEQMDPQEHTTDVPEDTSINAKDSQETSSRSHADATDSQETPSQSHADATDSQETPSQSQENTTDLPQPDSSSDTDFEVQEVAQKLASVPLPQSSDSPLEPDSPVIVTDSHNPITDVEEPEAGDPALERMVSMLNSLINEATVSVETPVKGREKNLYKQFDSSKLADPDFSDINAALDDFEANSFDDDDDESFIDEDDEDDSSSEAGEEEYGRGRNAQRGNMTRSRSKSRNAELFEYSMSEFNKSLTEFNTFVDEITMTDDTANEMMHEDDQQYWDPEEGVLRGNGEPLEDLDDFAQQCRLITRAIIIPFLKFTHTFMTKSLRKEEFGTIRSVIYIIYWTFLFTLGALVLDSWLCEVSGRQVIRLLMKLGRMSFDNQYSYDVVSKAAPHFNNNNPNLAAERRRSVAGRNKHDPSSSSSYYQIDSEDPRYKTQVYAFTVNDIIRILDN